MKTIIRGTLATNEIGSEPALLYQAGVSYMQRLAGYVPAKMSIEVHSTAYPPLSRQDALAADTMLSRLCDCEIAGANPRVPYLIAIWMLMGSTNPFQIYQRSNEKELIVQVASLLLRIACGDTVATDERKTVLRNVTLAKLATITPYMWKLRSRYGDNNAENRISAHHADVLATALLRVVGIVRTYEATAEWLAWTMGDVLHELAQISGNSVSKFIQAKAQSWCYINDAEIGLITRDIVFDMAVRQESPT